jgi:tricorn protease-like protein
LIFLSKTQVEKLKKHKETQKNKKQNTLSKHKKYKKEEQKLVKACMDYLRCKGFLVLRNNSGRIFINDNGKIRAIRAGMAGSSDIIACSPDGRFFAIECKSKKGRLTENQKEFLRKVSELGGVALVVRNIDELIGYCELHI